MHAQVSGPEFNIASDRLFIVGGNSERKEVLEPFARVIDSRGIFEKIDLITLNNLDGRSGRSIKQLMLVATVLGHSAAATRIKKARQFIAVNPPEQLDYRDQIKCAMDVGNDPIDKEMDTYKTGTLDLVKAGLQLVGSPLSTARTMHMIDEGFSGSSLLIRGAQDFPEGRAMVHSELDGFRFAQNAGLEAAALAGVTTLLLPGHYHNEMLLAPSRTVDLMTPVIFPSSQ